ncbi:MAG: WYL domain-containing protein [Saprospiraceae bacterium]|nr:WYL domain-containing protein [Saprospiraceae bacterium]
MSADRPYENLKSLLIFNKKEEDLLTLALQNMAADGNDVERLLKKMSRIYDLSKVSNTFDKNFLSKMDRLEKAKTDKKVVILRDYHSTNSSTVADRRVEPFKVSAEDDILHAFDLDKKQVRHYRISRISKLDLTDSDWQHEGSHYEQATDPFRIHSREHLRVHLRLNVGAYNALLESYPIARAYLKAAPDAAEQFDLVCKVNSKFYGLSNFIMGNYQNIVAIYEPDELIDHIQAEAKLLLGKINYFFSPY